MFFIPQSPVTSHQSPITKFGYLSSRRQQQNSCLRHYRYSQNFQKVEKNLLSS
ncbi:MAG TPA: hypothetical protein VK203_00750 [Nostocaceae cyanobacterium]|nr:hypothetical protein [Nostocaceae cyanobacterium]